jgi:WhiB family redox-sensing transcriptional regulator
MSQPHRHGEPHGERAGADLVDLWEPWWVHARCRGCSARIGAMFFSAEPGEIARAKRFCASCPVIAPCLEGALERREPCGVWGGQLFLQGRILVTKRRRGRPRRVPRPEDQLPDIPIPEHLVDLAVVVHST